MVDDGLRYLPLIAAFSALVIAVLALLRSLQASRATRAKKPTPSSLDSSLQALDSTLAAEKISHQLAKLENRLRMREMRETKGPGRCPAAAPPVGTPKGELFRHYGFTQAGPAFAQHQLDLERAAPMNGKE